METLYSFVEVSKMRLCRILKNFCLFFFTAADITFGFDSVALIMLLYNRS